jgi:L-lactate dehydrogenase complex protein LldE
VGEAAVKLIEQTGHRVRVPSQACCGQANFNGGDRAGAADLARRVIGAFRNCDVVVVPSGSCAGMIREYPALFAEDSPEREAAAALARKTFELTAFLLEVAHVQLAAVPWRVRIAYQDSCSSLRELGIREQPRALLRQVPGIEIAELRAPQDCCGFGGAFCAKYPEVSAHIADRKIDDIVEAGATHVVGADLGCLLHLEGRMQRRGIAVTAVHVAEALAGMVPGGYGRHDQR